MRNHPLLDGNERLGWVAVVVFSHVNGGQLRADEQGAHELLVGLAQGHLTLAQVTARLAGWRH